MIHWKDISMRFSRSPRQLVALAAVGILFLALPPRLWGIGVFLTADEKNWVGRGAEFVNALREFRFNDTLQTTHPGIPTLWVTGVSTVLTSRLTGQPFTFDVVHRFAVNGQLALAVLNSLLVVGIFLAARLLLPTTIALLGSLVIALDPFLIGHSKLVHVDALLTGFTALSFLLFLAAAQRRWSAALILGSAVSGALAILSKLPALILIPLVLGVLFADRSAWTAPERRRRARLFGQWLTFVLVTILLLWPGLLWVPDPVGNLKIVKRDLQTVVSTPHHMADAYGISFWHYPKTLLTRTTPSTLVGALLALGFLLVHTTRISRRLRKRYSGRPAETDFLHQDLRRTVWSLVLFVAVFVTLMTFGAKKGDRYVLAVFPFLDIIAAFGVSAAIFWVRPRWSALKVTALASVLLLVPLVVEVLRLGPYALAHFNPLFPPNWSQELGWGEGLDQVAKFLNAQDDGQRVAAASWYPEELRALVGRPVQHLSGHNDLRVGYVVLYRNMFGRPRGHPAQEFINQYYAQQAPVFTATVNGLPYAWVYRRPTYTSVVGELLEGTVLEAELPVSAGALRGFEVFLATYNGRANKGELTVRVRNERAGPYLRIVSVPLRGEDDNRWVQIPLHPPMERQAKGTLFVEITTVGTKPGSAPTIRVAADEKDAPPFWVRRPSLTGRSGAETRRGTGLPRVPHARDEWVGTGLLGIRALLIPL